MNAHILVVVTEKGEGMSNCKKSRFARNHLKQQLRKENHVKSKTMGYICLNLTKPREGK